MKYLFGVIFIASCTERRTAPLHENIFCTFPLGSGSGDPESCLSAKSNGTTLNAVSAS